MRGGQAALRVLRTEETVQRRERIAGQWHNQRDNDVVLGDDAVEESDVDAWAMAVRPWPLGYRERLLQHVGDALGLGPLLQARGDRDYKFLSRRLSCMPCCRVSGCGTSSRARAGLTLIGLAGTGSRPDRLPRPWCGLVPVLRKVDPPLPCRSEDPSSVPPIRGCVETPSGSQRSRHFARKKVGSCLATKTPNRKAARLRL